MDVKEAQKKKDELERNIEDALLSFTKETGASVTSICVYARIKTVEGVTLKYIVEIEACI